MEHAITFLAEPVFEELIQLTASFTPENFNKVPFEGSWTAAQVVEHIKLSAGNIVHLLNGATAETQRDPEAKVMAIRDLFMDFGKQFESPAFIVPEPGAYEQKPFVDFFSRLKEELSEAIESLDLSQTCLDRELPGFGSLTRVEWISFVIYHTQRHIHQLLRISQRL